MAEVYRTRVVGGGDVSSDTFLSQREDVVFADKVRELFKDDHGNLYEAFVSQWKLYMEGKVSKHDLFCEIVGIFEDKVEELFNGGDRGYLYETFLCQWKLFMEGKQ